MLVRKIAAALFLCLMTLSFAMPMLASAPAHAEEGAATVVSDDKLPPGSDNSYSSKKYIGLAMGLAIGLAAFGGALGQARASAAALEGIARNPGTYNKIFVPMILALAFIESLVLYALVIAFTLNGKL
jgi:F-type H+-transporting ATPase subunit c